MSGGDEVPAAPRVAPRQVGPEPPVAPVQTPARLLAVHVVDPVPEVVEETDRVQVLPHEVRRVEVEPEGRPAVHRLQGTDGRPVVVGDLARMHLVGEPHPLGVEDVQDRVPPGREVLVTALDHRLRHRREHRHQMPDGGPGETDDRLDPEGGRGTRGVLHTGRRPPPYALRLTVTPHLPRQDRPVAFVDDRVTHGLAHQMVGDRPALETVLVQEPVPGGEVGRVGQSLVDLEVIAPAGELETVVTEVTGQPADLLQRQIGPLTGEQREIARHTVSVLLRR
ncbi:hypothetical protein SGRIM128S_08849 [Streptomyces griseomycini]